MMDNEQPWQPPRKQSAPPMMEVTPQVPELTLFSPSTATISNRQDATTKNKNNFFQRMTKSNHPKPTVAFQSKTQEFISFSMQPAVPDITILDHQMVITPTTKKVSGDKVCKNNNIYEKMPKPSVPDVTILDDEPKAVEAPKQQNRVFDANYKQMLIDSHESFMKQIRQDEPNKPPETTGNHGTKDVKKSANNHKSNLFNMRQYQENPLKKYAPKRTTLAWDMKNVANLDSSSILVEGDFQTNNRNEEDQCDEKTFKKVADMLNQIQKLTTTESSTTAKSKESVRNIDNCPSKVLRQLALKYLTQEEQIYFDVENDLKDLEDVEVDRKNECANS